LKRNLLILISLLTIAGFAQSQVVSDFEVIEMNLMLGRFEDQSSMSSVPNPDPIGINSSNWVVKFVRDKDGFPWGEIIVGTTENPLANKVIVYSVPFNSNLTVNTSVELNSIIITASIGRQVVNMENLSIGSTTTNTSGLSNCLYFVTFYTKSDIPYT
jgi:hypothetical protein